MEEKKLWLFVQKKLQARQTVALMLVPESKGSSPGRQGHQMAIALDGELCGTIGGGAMEYKQVESCKKALKRKEPPTVWQHLIHDRKEREQWSGLSCSGEQTLLTYFLSEKDGPLIDSIINAYQADKTQLLTARPEGLFLNEAIDNGQEKYRYIFKNEEDWCYQVVLGAVGKVYIVGAGHVGLALCRQLSLLDFEIVLIDNRADLPTEEYDQFISKKIITSYQKVASFVPSTSKDYIVIMSFSSALDTLVLGALLDKPCCYIGMMASAKKVERVHQKMLEKGFTTAQFERVHTPIGLPITCKSPAEIAVSIAAELIYIRNKSKTT